MTFTTAPLAEVAGFFPWAFMRPIDADDSGRARSHDRVVGSGRKRPRPVRQSKRQ